MKIYIANDDDDDEEDGSSDDVQRKITTEDISKDLARKDTTEDPAREDDDYTMTGALAQGETTIPKSSAFSQSVHGYVQDFVHPQSDVESKCLLCEATLGL